MLLGETETLARLRPEEAGAPAAEGAGGSGTAGGSGSSGGSTSESGGQEGEEAAGGAASAGGEVSEAGAAVGHRGKEASGDDGGDERRVPSDVPSGEDDDVVARQLREAAMEEDDPQLREKLWEEYRRYKSGQRLPASAEGDEDGEGKDGG